MKRKQKTKKLLRLRQYIHRHIKLVFIPHAANQYRPHLIRRYGLIVLLVLVAGIQAGYNVSATGSVLGIKTPITTPELLADTNKERGNSGLRPLKMNARLTEAAQLKARDMVRQQYWAHVAPDGTTPWLWLAKAGYSYASAGENLAKNFTSSEATVTAWMASPEHRDNILSTQYDEVGFAVIDGVLNDKPTTLIVALYGQPTDAAAVAGAQTSSRQEVTATDGTIGIMTRLAIGLESMTPAALGSIFLMLVAVIVAFLAHGYRNKLPKQLRESWYRHHGIMKVGGMVSLVVIVIVLYGGGQI